MESDTFTPCLYRRAVSFRRCNKKRNCSLSIEKRAVIKTTYLGFRMPVFYSLHMGHLWLSVLIITYYEEKLHWWMTSRKAVSRESVSIHRRTHRNCTAYIRPAQVSQPKIQAQRRWGETWSPTLSQGAIYCQWIAIRRGKARCTNRITLGLSTVR